MTPESELDNAAKVAAKLTYKEAAAVRGVFAWSDPAEQDYGEARLYELGIWDPRPKCGQKAITPFGLAVRTALADRGGDR